MSLRTLTHNENQVLDLEKIPGEAGLCLVIIVDSSQDRARAV